MAGSASNCLRIRELTLVRRKSFSGGKVNSPNKGKIYTVPSHIRRLWAGQGRVAQWGASRNREASVRLILKAWRPTDSTSWCKSFTRGTLLRLWPILSLRDLRIYQENRAQMTPHSVGSNAFRLLGRGLCPEGTHPEAVLKGNCGDSRSAVTWIGVRRWSFNETPEGGENPSAGN